MERKRDEQRGRNDKQLDGARCCSTSENPINLDFVKIMSREDDKDLSDSSWLHAIQNPVDVNSDAFQEEVLCFQ